MKKKEMYFPPRAERICFSTEEVLSLSDGGIELPDHDWVTKYRLPKVDTFTEDV